MGDFDLDLIRAWASGKLPAERAAQFEKSMAADPELAEFAEAWRELDAYSDVEASHEADPESGMRSVLSFGVLEALMDQAPVVPWTPLLHVAAASVLFLGGILGLHSELSTNPSNTAVPSAHDIPFVEHAPPMDMELDEQLAALRDYQPIKNGEVQWLDSIAAGQLLGRATGRPLLVWCIHPTCPFCKKMRESTLLDLDVQEALEQFVPVQLNVMQEARYANMTLEHGFPMFEVLTNELGDLHRFYNYQESKPFIGELSRGIEGLEKDLDGASLSWKRWPDAVGTLLDARAAERAGRFGEALRGYQAMGELGAGLQLSELSEAGERRLALLANNYLHQAQRNADPARVLGGAAWVFRGSSFEAEFQKLERAARGE